MDRTTPPEATPPEATPRAGWPIAVRARGLGLDGPRGPVFGGVDLLVPAGSLLAVPGPAGAGRTSLLLTLAGRMLPDRGEAEVAGHPLPRARNAVQQQVALAVVHGVNDLDGALTVEEHLLERLALTSPWWRLLTPSTTEVPVALATVDQHGRPALDRDALVRDLEPYDRFRLGIALALADRDRRHPRVLVADDVDELRDPHHVACAWRLLVGLAGSDPAHVPGGLTVVASCTSAETLPSAVRTSGRVVLHHLAPPGPGGWPQARTATPEPTEEATR
ncbi:MAG TPA: ATP-binding cassette domain-containing protein [Kineosporiaceae bacterium]